MLIRISVLILFLMINPCLSWAATYYVRTDGSNSTNCTGLADAAYDGSGTGEACAFSHPFYATGWFGDEGNGDGDPTAGVMSTGDELVIVSGNYNMGYDASWAGCSASWSYGCQMQPLVDGDSGNHSSIKGCTTSGCSNNADRPGLYGMGRTHSVLDLAGTDYFDVQDLKIYDTGTCGSNHATLACGSADSSEATMQDGIRITGATNGTLTDVSSYGAYRYGMFGGSVENISLDNVDLSYNAFGGWNLDNCDGDGCGSSGNISFSNGTRVVYNGCIMTETFETIETNGCYSQDQGGYGDGIGSNNTGGNWTFTNVNISHNVSDGIDLLYLNRGSYSGGSVVVKKSLFEGNAGNNIKVPNNYVDEDNINIANCGYFQGQSFACTAGTCGSAFNNCRANGNAVSIEFKSGDSSTPRISSSTFLTNSDVAIQTSGTCTTGIDVFASNNIFLGGTEFNDGSDLTSIYYDAGTDGSGANCDTDFVETNNICYNMKEGASACTGTNSISGTGIPSNLFTGTILQGPTTYYTNDDYSEQIELDSTSDARGVSDESFSGADSLDYNSVERGADWDAGALEYNSESPSAPAPVVRHTGGIRITGSKRFQ